MRPSSYQVLFVLEAPTLPVEEHLARALRSLLTVVDNAAARADKPFLYNTQPTRWAVWLNTMPTCLSLRLSSAW